MSDNDLVKRGEIKAFRRSFVWCGYLVSGVTIEDIDCIPAVDAKPVVRGEWVDMATKHEQRAGRHDYRCSLCKERASNYVGGYDEWWDMWTPNFCPNCGADMRQKQG